MKRTFNLIITLFGLLAFAACAQSKQDLVEKSELVPMSTDEILAAVTGNSEVWPGQGAGYYQEDGTFLGIWEGDKAQGPWWVENDIRCYDVEEWGGEWCHEFYRQGEEIVLVRQGTNRILPNKIEPGNQLPQ